MSEYDPGIVVMLEQIERTPDAFSRGSLVGACCRARMKLDDIAADRDNWQKAALALHKIVWLYLHKNDGALIFTKDEVAIAGEPQRIEWLTWEDGSTVIRPFTSAPEGDR